MKISAIISQQALRFMKVKRPVYMPQVVNMLRERYGFVRVPVTAEEMLPPSDNIPIAFQHGVLNAGDRTINIEDVRLYGQFVAVSTLTSTDDADIVADDLERIGGDFVEVNPQRMYISQLEVILEGVPEWLSPVLSNLGVKLTEAVSSYLPDRQPPNAMIPGFRMFALWMSTDPTQWVIPCDFRVERRPNFGTNLFFSQAPLRTKDHHAILGWFEESVEAAGRG